MKAFDAIVRVTQRHLIPGFVSSLYYLVRSRVLVNPGARVQVSKSIRIGKGSVVKAFAVIQTTGGFVELGTDCAVGNFNHITAGSGGIRIGNHVRMGPNVTIIAINNNIRRKDQLIVNQGYSSKGIEIGNDVLIGAGATILDGCKIGTGAVIGVNSLVNKNVPPFSIVFGSPAKTIFKRT